MCGDNPRLTLERILADDLIRLVMASDGVSEAELRVVLENARRAVAAHGSARRAPAQQGWHAARPAPKWEGAPAGW